MKRRAAILFLLMAAAAILFALSAVSYERHDIQRREAVLQALDEIQKLQSALHWAKLSQQPDALEDVLSSLDRLDRLQASSGGLVECPGWAFAARVLRGEEEPGLFAAGEGMFSQGEAHFIANLYSGSAGLSQDLKDFADQPVINPVTLNLCLSSYGGNLSRALSYIQRGEVFPWPGP